MLLSLALILIIGFSLSGIFNRIHIPGLLAMIITGIVLGPYVLNLISIDILTISGELRRIALIVILLRAGLSLDLKDLRLVGRSAILMGFISATMEIGAVMMLARALLGLPWLEAALMGTVVAAVSPAVILPRMIKLIESGHGRERRIPQLIMASASVDNVYVIVLFTALLGMQSSGEFQMRALVNVPVSIVLGLAVGIGVGYGLVRVFQRIHVRDTIKVLIILSFSFLLFELESWIAPFVPVSGLLAVLALGIMVLKTKQTLAKRLLGKFSKLWVGTEILLFVLIGAAVDIRSLSDIGLMSVVIIIGAMAVRFCGVLLSLMGTALNGKERFYSAISFLPKATVQAAIGAIPLASGVASGNIILSVAVLAAIISAPIGAVGMDAAYGRLLMQES